MGVGRGEDVGDDEIVQVLRDAGVRLQTQEVAAELPIKPEQTRVRLIALMDEGRVQGIKVGNAWLWSLAD